MNPDPGDLRIGKLRDRISFLSPNRSENSDTGQITTEYVPQHTGVPASVRLTQVETERAGRMVTTTKYEIVIRWLPNLEFKTDRRVEIDGGICEVLSIVCPDRRRRWLFVTAVATT